MNIEIMKLVRDNIKMGSVLSFAEVMIIQQAIDAAILQGAEQQNQQQNIPENIPVTQFKPAADLYGLTSPTGGETLFTFDAVEARDFIDGGWSCQEYVELERFQEAVSSNSPVIPDGWVMVPVNATRAMIDAARTVEEDGYDAMHKAMIAAAPQQEVNNVSKIS
ncbi:TPA: eaa protein [Citrobacter farmeri]|nr:eaa protein [Citrobacter farmeri]HCD7631293.1 eaa protein [Citrobacter farmeri]